MQSRTDAEKAEKERRDNLDMQYKQAAYRAALHEEHAGRRILDRIDETTETMLEKRQAEIIIGLPPDEHKPMKSGVYKWSDSLDDDEKFYYEDQGQGKGKLTWAPRAGYDHSTPEKLATMIYKMSLAAAYEGKVPCYIHLHKHNVNSARAMLEAFERNANDKTPIDMRLSSEDFHKLELQLGNSNGTGIGIKGVLEESRLQEMYGTKNVVEALRIAQQRSIERYAKFIGYIPEDYNSKNRAKEYKQANKEMTTDVNTTYSEDLRSGDMNKLFNSIPADAAGKKDPAACMAKMDEMNKMILARTDALDKSIREMESEVSKRENVVSDLESKASKGYGDSDHANAIGVRSANDNELDARIDLLQSMKSEMKELQRLRDSLRREVTDTTKGYDATQAGKIKADLDNGDKKYPGDDASIDKSIGDIKKRYLSVDDKVNVVLDNIKKQAQSQSSSPKPV